MPRESDANTSDDAASRDSNRVTRSLRKRLNSTDFEESPVTASQTNSRPSTRNKLNSISEKDADLDNSNSTLTNDKVVTPDETIVRKTRARMSSALTEENVTALNNTPSRRMTRRNSGAQEPSVTVSAALPLTGTPSRRSTRRTSVTSDDYASSVASSTLVTRPRRNVAAPQTYSEDEPTVSTRKTPGRKSLAAPPPTVPEEPELDEISPTPRKTPLRVSRNTTLVDDTDAPHPVAIHKSLDTSIAKATPTKQMQCRVVIDRAEVLQKTRDFIIEIIDESCEPTEQSPSIVKLEDTATPTKLQRSVEVLQKARPSIIDITGESSEQSPVIVNSKETPTKANKSATQLNTTGNTTPSANGDGPLATPVKKSQRLSLSSQTASTFFVVDASTSELNVSQKSSKLNDSQQQNASGDASLKTENVSAPYIAAAVSPAAQNVSGELKEQIDASRVSVAAASKSVTFAEVAANTSGKSDDVFHDTCTELVDHDVSSDEVADPSLKIYAGATPSRTRFNLSLHSSTPLVNAAATAEAANESADVLKRPRGRPALKRASIHAIIAQSPAPPQPEAPLSRSWSQAVHGTSASQIDKSAQDLSVDEKVIKRPVRKAQLDDFDDDNEEDSTAEKVLVRNSFVDDEAQEVEDEDDSMDSSTRAYLKENEVPVDGVSIGSKDSELGDDQVDEEDDEMNSFIVSDGDEDDLLEGTGDDLSSDAETVTKPRRSVLRLADSSDDEKVDEAFEKIEESNVKETVKKVEEAFEKDDSVDASDAATKADAIEEDQHQSLEEVSAELNTSIDVSERQTNLLLSKTISEPNTTKTKSQRNKSLGAATAKNAEIDFSAYVQAAKSKSNNSDAMQSDSANVLAISVGDRQTNQLLSKSVHEGGKSKSHKAKHNKSLNTSAMDVDDVDITFSSYVQAPVTTPSPKSAAAQSEEPSLGSIDSVNDDIVMISPPKVKAPKVKAPAQIAAPVNYNDILNRCQSLLEKAHEARRADKAQNKKDVPEEVVERLKSKRELKQLEKARRAANLLKLQQDEAERIKRKAAKKLLKKSKVTEPTVEISKAIAHGIELLAKTVKAPELVAVAPPVVTVAKPVSVTKPVVAAAKPVVAAVANIPVVQKDKKKKKKDKRVAPTIVEQSPPEIPVAHPKKHSKKNVVPANDYVEEIVAPIAKKQKKMKKPETSVVEVLFEPAERKLSKKNKRPLEDVEAAVQSVAKKPKVRLNILTKTVSPDLTPDPTTVKLPKKPPTEYNVLQVRSVAAGQQQKAISRKRKPTAPPSPIKPQWTSAGEFLVSKLPFVQSENRVHTKTIGTDFVVTSLSKKRKLKATTSEPVANVHAAAPAVAEYRANATNSERIKRETTAQLLQHKKKMHAYTRF